MMKRTHAVAGVIITGTLCYYTPLDRLPLILGFIGSTAPDLDMMFGHRKITHSLLGICIAFGLCSIFNVVFAISFCTNCLIHIVLDSFTLKGVPLFYPYNKKYYGFKEIKSGGVEDKYFCLMMIFFDRVYISRNLNKTRNI